MAAQPGHFSPSGVHVRVLPAAQRIGEEPPTARSKWSRAPPNGRLGRGRGVGEEVRHSMDAQVGLAGAEQRRCSLSLVPLPLQAPRALLLGRHRLSIPARSSGHVGTSLHRGHVLAAAPAAAVLTGLRDTLRARHAVPYLLHPTPRTQDGGGVPGGAGEGGRPGRRQAARSPGRAPVPDAAGACQQPKLGRCACCAQPAGCCFLMKCSP